MKLIQKIIALLAFVLCVNLNAQSVSTSTLDVIPDSIKQICDKLFVSEIGKKLVDTHLKFEKLEGKKSVYKTGEARIDYIISYTFSYPEIRGATITLKMNYSVYSGKGHLQSNRFLRIDRTDLPKNFKKQSAKIIDYDKAKSIAFKTDAKIKAPKGEEKGHFVLFNDSFYWVFTTSVSESNPNGDAENVKEQTLVVDPYTGKILVDAEPHTVEVKKD